MTAARADLIATALGNPGQLDDPTFPAGYRERTNRSLVARWAETWAHSLAYQVTANLKPTGSLWIAVPGLEAWRVALHLTDRYGLALRAEVVVQESEHQHGRWFHLVRQPKGYFAAVDDVREEPIGGHSGTAATFARATTAGQVPGQRTQHRADRAPVAAVHPAGKLPGSVWSIDTDPARRIVAGWCPAGICSVCDEPRWPVVIRSGYDPTRPQARRALELAEQHGLTPDHFAAIRAAGAGADGSTPSMTKTKTMGDLAAEAKAVLGSYWREFAIERRVVAGERCACTPYRDHPRRQHDDADWRPERDRLADGDGYGSADLPGSSFSGRPRSGAGREYLLDGWEPPETTPGVVYDPFGSGVVTSAAAELGRRYVDGSSPPPAWMVAPPS